MDTANRHDRVLVTGAAGFIGSHTVDHLLARDVAVLGVDDLSSGNRANLESAALSPGFSFEEADVAVAGVIDRLASEFRPQAIVHLAALVSVPRGEEDPGENFRLNVLGTHLVAEAARTHGIRRVVYASSAAVYGSATELPLSEEMPAEPISQYGATKLMSEKLLGSYAGSYGLSPVCFRYFNVYGPRQDPASPYSGVVSIFADRFRERRPATIYGDGRQTRDFIYVGDVAKDNAAAAMDPKLAAGVFNRCTGDAQSLLDLVEILESRYPGGPALKYENERSGDIRHSLGDPSKATDILRLKAETPFSKGIAALLDSLEDAEVSA